MQGIGRISRGLVTAVLAIGLLPAGASAAVAAVSPPVAQAPAPPSASAAPVAPAAPIVKRKPAIGRLELRLTGAFHINRRPVTVVGRALRVNGVVRPYIRGQIVIVHAFIGRELIHSSSERVIRSRGGTYGHFSARLASTRPGTVFISAVDGGSAEMRRLVAYAGFSVLDQRASFGSRGRFVQLIQGRLALAHFYIPQTGVYDDGTGLAIDAYHRLRGWGTSELLDRPTIAGLLDGSGGFHVRFPREGKHAEGNLSDQLLALINGGRVYRIYPISSGKPSTPTILGHFRVYLKDPYYLPDGMYFSNFFYGGYAIHGYDPAPDYPASHGCMRVPIRDAVSIYNWLGFGTGVDVYY